MHGALGRRVALDTRRRRAHGFCNFEERVSSGRDAQGRQGSRTRAGMPGQDGERAEKEQRRESGRTFAQTGVTV